MELLPVRVPLSALQETSSELHYLSSEGTGRVTIFAAQSNARTFDYQAGDIGGWYALLIPVPVLTF
jgi:hypothetical protein